MILAANVAAPAALVALWPHSAWAAVGTLAAAHMLALYPTLRASSQWWGPVVTRFQPESPAEIWLTIDDGPDPADTPRILDLLDSHSARATFFVKGELVRRYPGLVRTIRQHGHTIGNHSDTHPSGTFWCLPPGRIRSEIDRANAAIREAIEEPPSYFRAPVGMKNMWVHPLLADRRMRLIGWSARGFDTVAASPAAAASRILRQVEPGAIVLLHEGRAVSEHDGYQVLEQLLPRLSERGYRCIVPRDDQLRAE